MNKPLSVLVVAGTAALCAGAQLAAAIPAHVLFDRPPVVAVDGEPWLGMSGQCACFRRSLRIAASEPVAIELDDRVLGGYGTIELRVLEADASIQPREVRCARSFHGITLGHRRIAIDVRAGSFDWIAAPDRDR